MSYLNKLRRMVRRLRSPVDGCAWDRAQTFESVVPHTLEEAYEVAEAIESGRLDELPAELGDLLFQVVFYCQLAEESDQFNFEDVVRQLETKLIERHPHVFGSSRVEDAEAVSRLWEGHKAEERRAGHPQKTYSELDNVPLNFPALTRAVKLQKRAARVGFDWPSAEGVEQKIDEELVELRHAKRMEDQSAVEEEFGDLIFTIVNLARHLGCDPETALRTANRKFERRFRFIEVELEVEGMSPEDVDLDHLERLWQAAKRTGL